ncbi:hypothetical protein ACQP1G_33150 [Nocardia sp. CA-107356]|uniref:hypothetical protein n=1 Tax=Nocardia sp. CA-107356 TaxID=3239972 RepID=UPI003D8E4308
MPDNARSSPQSDTRRQPSNRVGVSRGSRRKPRRSFVPAKELSENATTFADSSDRLVRRLFDVGLRLHKLRVVFDRRDTSSEELRTTSDAIAEMLDDLDGLIRETGLAMLELARERHAEPPQQTHTEATHDGRMTNRSGRLR